MCVLVFVGFCIVFVCVVIKGQLVRVLFFHYVDLGDKTQVASLGDKPC